MRASDDGFTLIELLVVILIVAILAAIAIPVFLRQREKGWVAQVQQSLKSAQTATESYFVKNGSYGPLNSDPQVVDRLKEEGFRPTEGVTITVKSTAQTYCIQATHANLPTGHDWKTATLGSDTGAPSTADSCPGTSTG